MTDNQQKPNGKPERPTIQLRCHISILDTKPTTLAFSDNQEYLAILMAAGLEDLTVILGGNTDKEGLERKLTTGSGSMHIEANNEGFLLTIDCGFGLNEKMEEEICARLLKSDGGRLTAVDRELGRLAGTFIKAGFGIGQSRVSVDRRLDQTNKQLRYYTLAPRSQGGHTSATLNDMLTHAFDA